MSGREEGRRRYRRALLPGLVLSAAAHVLVLALVGLDVPEIDLGEDVDAERYERSSLEVVAIRSTPARRSEAPADRTRAARSSGKVGVSAPAASAARSADAPAVRLPRSSELTAEPVPRPASSPALRLEERRRERLTATELAALSAGSAQMPRPTSRAAREVSGEPRDVGDRFAGAGGTRRAGPSGGGCTANPGTIIDRRFPRGLAGGGS